MPRTEQTVINSSPIFTSIITVQAYTRTTIGIAVGSLSAGSAINLGGSFTGTVFLQRSLNNGVTFHDVSSWAVATQEISDVPEALTYQYRAGVKAGGYTSGEAVIVIGSQ